MKYEAWRNYFERVISVPEKEIPLAEAALIIASDEYPDLEVSVYLTRLDTMADELRPRIADEREPRATIEKINRYLFDELEFHGNRAEYDDPRNSYLNDVLNRRTGLPITLSVVVIALADKLRLPIFGVGLPGHFVVKWRDEHIEIVFDPFNGGEIMGRRAIEERVREIANPVTPFQASWLDAVGTKYTLTRMLQNLKALFVRQEQLDRAWQVVDKLLLLDPRAPDEIRDFGLLSLNLGAYRQAAISLEQYLLAHPDAPDADRIRIYLRRALDQVERLN